MSLKSALFEMKQLLNDPQVELDEKWIQELEMKNSLKAGSLVFYLNNMMMVKTNSMVNQSGEDTKKVNRKWTKAEMAFMFQYIKERQDEGALNITEILEEIAHLLNRGYQSVNYKYYNLLKEKDKKQPESSKSYNFTTIEFNEVPVVATEIKKDTPPVVSSTALPVKEPVMPANSTDLIDILSGLITNVQQLPGINLNELLLSLYQLTNMALQNQDAVQQMENMKSEISFENDSLKQQLLLERKRNDELQREVSKLSKEIHAFNELGDAAKIQNLKSYNQRLKYIVDNFGVVL
ncbi:hypothetical protein [Neobacillus muris]|uniref:hypothetical protein n=1 Tax=Neobacillus muris TaxID=2941334 RepID=UPI00203DB66E|nr:hypothetical protein [Neobacillus muris]